jgi:hypothetical protein
MGSWWCYPLLRPCLFAAALSALAAWRFAAALRRTRWRPPPAGGPPRGARLSVTIPARNEGRDLGEALRSVLGRGRTPSCGSSWAGDEP